MDSSILGTLDEIRITVNLMLAMVSLGVLASWVRVALLIRTEFKIKQRDVFSTAAEALYASGQIDALLTRCEHELTDRPNSSNAIWYKAKAHYLKGDIEATRKALERLELIEPSWRESHVKPFLAAVRQLEGGTR